MILWFEDKRIFQNRLYPNKCIITSSKTSWTRWRFSLIVYFEPILSIAFNVFFLYRDKKLIKIALFKRVKLIKKNTKNVRCSLTVRVEIKRSSCCMYADFELRSLSLICFPFILISAFNLNLLRYLKLSTFNSVVLPTCKK